jgi:AcrR family transcriptional regulator
MPVVGETRPSWRERVRSGTIQEIKRTAREVLTEEGQSGLTIRAVARRMGMSSPSLYRYFGSHDELVGALIVELLDDLAGHIRTALDEDPHADPGVRIQLACRALRQWALDHPRAFDLIMTTPIDPTTAGAGTDIDEARWRFAGVFAELFVRLWRQRRFPAPPARTLAPGLRSAAELAKTRLDLPLPIGAVAVFLRCWVRLYGVVCMDSVGQLRLIGDAGGALFEWELRELSGELGLTPAP